MTTPPRLFRGGTIRPRVGAPAVAELLVRDGVVAAVGEGLQPPIGTDVVDLGGRALLPGFVDAHVHPPMAGLQRLGHRIDEGSDLPSTWAQVREAAASVGAGWLVVTGYSAILFARARVTRHDLDEIVGHRPALLVNSDQHGGLASTTALRASGLWDDTGDARLVERDAGGVPTGLVNEEGLGRLLAAVPPPTRAAQEAALIEGIRMLNSVGVVGWQDAMVGSLSGAFDSGPLYRAFAEDGRLTARVSAALGWDRARGIEQIDELRERRAQLPTGSFHAPAVKIFVDGVLEAGTAAMLTDYADTAGIPLGTAGGSLIDPAALRTAVVALDRAGFDVHMHAIGDRAVRSALDAVAAARDGGDPSRRHQIAHAMFVDPADLPRFAALDVTLDLQPIWAAADFLDYGQYAVYVGPERLAAMMRLADWDRTGLRWAFGSDWPVNTPDPLQGIRGAVRRALVGEAAARFDHQVLSAETAWRAATEGAAYASRLDGNGTLVAGANADFIVLDVDPFASTAADPVLEETWFAGEPVFRRAEG